jgi:hypothetical protein
LQDLAGTITWRGGEERTQAFVATPIILDDLQSVDDLVQETTQTVAIGDFKVALPPSLRLGVAVDHERWTFAGDYALGWGGRGLAKRPAELAGGLLYRASGVIDLRAGLQLTDGGRPSVSGGIGLAGGPTRVDLAVSSQGGVLPLHDEGVGVALGFGLRFE